MTIEGGTGAAVGAADASSPATAGAATGSTGVGGGSEGASAGIGNAPGSGADAGLGPEGGEGTAVAAPAAAPAPDGYVFAGRKFRDQKHAEDYTKAQLGILPGTQRKLAALERMIDERNAELESLRRSGTGSRGVVQGDDGQRGEPGAQPANWGKALKDSGDLELVADIAQQEGGFGPKTLFALSTVLGERVEAEIDRRVEDRVEGRIGSIEKQRQFDQHMGKVQAAIRQLGPIYPEFDESNDTPEAEEARLGIIGIWKSFPPEFSLGNPLRALKIAVQEYREEHGTPVFAVAPGSSGSPSARVAAAAERGSAGDAVLDTGVRARPRPAGQPLSAQEELAQSLSKADATHVRTSSGFDLGVRRVS